MQDNALIQLFLPLLNTGLVAAGFTGVQVVQSNQPRQFGVNTPSTVYFYKVGDYRYGWLRRYDVWDSNTGMMVHREIQNYETTFRVMALAFQDPYQPSLYTASDLVNECSAIMQSDLTIDTLVANDVGIYKIGQVQNPYFVDDHDNFKASPSFDFTLTHKQIITSNNPIISDEIVNIYRV